MLITTTCEVCNSEFQFKKLKPSKKDKRTCSKRCSYKLRNKTRSTIHCPLEKRCVDCKNIFQDTSKKKYVIRCKSCINYRMVKTRKESGSYVRTDEQNKKLSESLRKKYEEGWNPNTVEHRQKCSNVMKNGWADGSIPKKMKETSMKRYGEEHWSKTEAGRMFSSSLHKGRKFSESIRRKMSISASKRIRNKRELNYTSARGGIREDINNTYFRSCWEANFARILNYLGKSWEYESMSFSLSNGTTYTPDFLCDGVYYEIKGRMSEICEKKLSYMKIEYSDVKLELIDYAKYNDLRTRYKNILPFWEGK